MSVVYPRFVSRFVGKEKTIDCKKNADVCLSVTTVMCLPLPFVSQPHFV